MKNEIANIIERKRNIDPIKNYLWYVELPTDIVGFDGDVYELNSRIASFNAPFPTIDSDKQRDGNSFWYYANSIDIGSISLEIYEYEDGRSFDYFFAWQKMINRGDGTFNVPIYYKRDIRFFRLDMQKNKIMVDLYTGYFVTGVSDITNEYETSGATKFAVNFTGDDHIHINSKNAADIQHPDYRRLAEVTDLVVSAKEFINVVKEARHSLSSISEILL